MIELWVIPNPYTDSTVVAPLGPPSEFRDPTDFCWTTTIKQKEVNFAPISVILLITTLIAVSAQYIWNKRQFNNPQQLTIALDRVIRQSAPDVDKFTDLGCPRDQVDMDAEYQ